MKKQVKKALSITLALAAVLSLSAYAAPLKAVGYEEDVSGRILAYTMNSTQAFAYIPDGLEGGRRGAGRGNTTAIQQIAPVILVYGNEPFTEESALATAYSSGLAAIAAKEQAVISFVNPRNGEFWTQDDVRTYSSIVQNKYVERPAQSLTPVAGVYPQTAAAPGGQFAGYFYRTIIVAEGSGADFAAQYLMDDTLVDSRNIQTIPAAYMLFNAAEVPGAKAGIYDQEYPAVVVNGTQELVGAIAALNSNEDYLMIGTGSTEGFDSAMISKGYKSLAGLMVRPQMSYSPLPNTYIGLFKISNNLELDDLYDYGYTSKAVTGGTAWYDYYIPNNIDRSAEKSIPLVMVFHGSGETSEYIAKMGGWTRLGYPEGFMVVSVDNHGSAAIQHALLDALLEEFTFLDPSRVYATGFSMGAAKTWDMISTAAYAAKIAAISPWSYLTAPGSAQTSVIVPTYYTQGWWDTTVNWPTSNTSGQANRIRQLFVMNNIGAYTYDRNVHYYWGVLGDINETQDAKSWKGDINIHTFYSEDGEIYTKLVDASNFGHGISGDFGPMAWEFMKNFVRNEDGSVGWIMADKQAAASVEKLNGNNNNLTITVTETYANGSTNVIEVTFNISNNAAGAYNVGPYTVYVDTKGNDQIRACYFVD